MDVLSSTTPKARKDHQCNYCEETIPEGQIYHNHICVQDSIYQWKTHVNCQKLSNEFWRSFPEWLDSSYGMTTEDFNECLNQAVSELENAEEVIYLSKAEQIEVLIKHYEL